MGNYCSSGQNKKDKDNSSQKSEEWVLSKIDFLCFHTFIVFFEATLSFLAQ